MEGTIRIAAVGDVHAAEPVRERVAEALEAAAREADVIMLAGDLTSHGLPVEAEVLAQACRGLGAPVYAVLGNHDWHENRQGEVTAVLRAGGVNVLERGHDVVTLNGTRLGIVGTKGFVGGFPGSHLPDFGERLLRDVYAETTEEVRALERGLQAVADCPLRVVLLHYSPSLDTLAGEPEGIWAFLGSMRLAGPIAEHHPDLVLHGHAHEGTFAGAIGGVPVYNVAQPVIGREFAVFELEPTGSTALPRAAVDAKSG